MTVAEAEKQGTAQMAKAVAYFKDELRGVRTGRAAPGLVEHLRIEVPTYGSTMELRELAAISAPDPATIMVKPFDPSTLKDIERGIRSSDIGITPMSDGKIIRLPVPPLSGERRQQLVAQVRKMAEAQKIAVRNVRRDLNKLIDTSEKSDEMTEDEAKDAKDRIQKLTKKHEDEIDALTAAKTKEMQEV
ncbi:MAG TPA: ribosome recycling factor [Phycisphaerae bacterium]|jgi:ribosome recycling factor